MKTLKFAPELCEQILSGTKTSTWRLFDEKGIRDDDELQFVNKETGAVLGFATVVGLKVTTLGTLIEEDWVGHERYDSEKEMYQTYKKYYGNKVNAKSEVKIIDFKFQPT